MAEYLEANNLNIKKSETKTLFHLKSKVVDAKAKYPPAFNNNKTCTLCDKEGNIREDTQKHTLKWPIIRRTKSVNEEI